MVVLYLSVCCCNGNTQEICHYLQYICKFLCNRSFFVWLCRNIGWCVCVRHVTEQEGKTFVSSRFVSVCTLHDSMWIKPGGVRPWLKLTHRTNIETSVGFSSLSIITVVLSVWSDSSSTYKATITVYFQYKCHIKFQTYIIKWLQMKILDFYCWQRGTNYVV